VQQASTTGGLTLRHHRVVCASCDELSGNLKKTSDFVFFIKKKEVRRAKEQSLEQKGESSGD